MILAGGKLYDTEDQDKILSGLEEEINKTREEKALSAETVIHAAEKLCARVKEGAFDPLFQELGLDCKKIVEMASHFLSAESIRYRLEIELAGLTAGEMKTGCAADGKSVTIRPMPLGTLFHIAAGNMDGLPAFSVAEGLLTGNVNILKLPQADRGISVAVLQELVRLEPELADFLYVFDTPSSDLSAMKKMAQMSDGIVVWGSDEAVAAVRRLAPVTVKLIEWGHKLGFAYISGYENQAQELRALARHIVETDQLLCSSCQTIFLDTDNMEEVWDFCREFLPLLESEAAKRPRPQIGAAAEITLRRYGGTLERILGGQADGEKSFYGEFCRLTACTDSVLELSGMFGDCLVKRLPRDKLFSVLRRQKGYLQTAGLICASPKREELTTLLARAGVVRITRAGNMSEAFEGEAHDGRYPLREYLRIVNIE